MRVIDLLNKIANGEIIEAFEYNEELYIWDEQDKWYLSEPLLNYFTVSFKKLNDEIKVVYKEIKEDKDIPLIPDDELKDDYTQKNLDFNFKVLKEKINQIATEFNEYRKENE
ncbi:MAG: hypothetical protein IJI98_03380 [Methanosphaera sp.]|nr:hypothetical protein [Methanosphaera sp.]